MNQLREEFVDDGDEVIARVREARHRISARFDHDPYKLVAHYMELQKRPDRLIRASESVEESDQSAA